MCTGISGVALGEAGDRTREKGSGGRVAVLCMEYLRHLRVHWVHLQWDMVSWIASVWTCSVRCARRRRRWRAGGIRGDDDLAGPIARTRKASQWDRGTAGGRMSLGRHDH